MVAAIIQARMGSSRFPGKVLKPLAGKPILWHIIHRLKKCRSVDVIAVATSINPKDNPIESFALKEGIKVVRGSEDNVLSRYYLAAQELGARIIIRVTGDAPLVDPELIDLLVKTLLQKEADYCALDPQISNIHEGFSPFTFYALEKLIKEAGDDPVAMEHVTAYFKKHPDFVKGTFAPIDPDYQLKGARISVDTPADFRFLEEVYARLHIPAGEADVRDVVKLLRSEPNILNINAHVHQKGMDEQTRRVLFRCDGSPRLGLGHIYRCLALADELRESHGWGVTFAMAEGPVGVELVTRADYPVEEKQGLQEDFWLDEVIQRLHPDVLVLDIRSGLNRGSVQKWRRNGALIVTLDDPSERRLAADLAFYPPMPQVQSMNWSGFTGRRYSGWKWIVLRRQFAQKPERDPNKRPVVLITMGGSDPAGMTLKVVKALDLLNEDFETVVMLGPGFSYHEALKELLTGARRKFDIREKAEELPGLMAEAGLAVASLGVTAYELAAMGVPAIYLCLTEDHAESASTLVEAGMGISLGLFSNVTEKVLAEAVRSLLNDVPGRLRMAHQAIEQMDGKGTGRIAQIVAARIKNSNG